MPTDRGPNDLRCRNLFGESDPGASHDPEEALDWARRRQVTRDFLAQLDGEFERFARLRFVEDLSQNEVARTMGITRRRARTLEHRLLGALRRKLQKLFWGGCRPR
jgi:RNA polymerase sigma factor (sigma-70 family)